MSDSTQKLRSWHSLHNLQPSLSSDFLLLEPGEEPLLIFVRALWMF